MIKIGLRVFVRENRAQNVKNVNGRGSTEQVHTNIIDRSGGVMGKYTKHRFFTVFVLEIRASLYSTPLNGPIPLFFCFFLFFVFLSPLREFSFIFRCKVCLAAGGHFKKLEILPTLHFERAKISER